MRGGGSGVSAGAYYRQDDGAVGRSQGMEQREVVWGREWWRWTVGVGAAAGVDATLLRIRYGAE